MQAPASTTLGALIEENAMRFGARPAVSFDGETVSFSELRNRVRAFAKVLHASGVRPEDKVGVLMGNRIEWLVSCFAIQYVGATMVAINTWYTARELAYVLEHADVAVLITVERYLKSDYRAILDGMQPLATRFPLLRRVVMFDGKGYGDTPSPDALMAAGRALDDQAVLDALARVRPDDLAYILYTSGSTAHPKGVMLHHRGLLSNTWDIGERLHFAPDDVLYLPISLFWGFGCENMLLSSWTHGVHIVLQPQFDAQEGLALIRQHGCTAMTATANIAHAMFGEATGAMVPPTLAKGSVSGSPPAKRRMFERVLALGCSAYGLTEAYGYAAVSDASDPIEARAHSDGRPLPGIEMRIVAADGRILPAGEVGEIRLRGHVTTGYYKDEAATRASFDADGFLKTGDLGMLDAAGHLHFQGRLKEVLKSGGITITPVEIEGVLRSHPGVLEAFVTGLPDAVLGTSVAAVVVARAGVSLQKDDLTSFCRDKLAAYKIPRSYVFTSMEQLPYTSTQKVQRLRLPSLFEPSVA